MTGLISLEAPSRPLGPTDGLWFREQKLYYVTLLSYKQNQSNLTQYDSHRHRDKVNTVTYIVLISSASVSADKHTSNVYISWLLAPVCM